MPNQAQYCREMKFFSIYSIFLLLLLSSYLSSAQPNFRFLYCDNSYGNFTNSSTYATNLKTLLSAIASDSKLTSGVNFLNTSTGNNAGVEQINGIAFCRGDVTPSTCKSCISNAALKIREVCPNRKQAIGWYNECMLRYSNRSIFGNMESLPLIVAFNTANASDVNAFNHQLGNLLRTLQSTAAAGNSGQLFAAGGPVTVTDFVSIYGLVECTPDLTSLDCSNCINGIINYIPNCCDGKIGAIYVNPSCDVRYDVNQFFNSVNDTLPPPSSSRPNVTASVTTGRKISKGVKLAIAMVIPVVTCILLIVVVTCWCLKTKTRKRVELSPFIHKTKDDDNTIESLRFDFGMIKEATNNFSEANKLGQGGFGSVYKGTLPNGQQVAVKRLAKNSTQGQLEFKNEVLLVAQLRHRNLVKLLGFCLDGDERLLVYEFLSNSSLDHLLFDPIKRVQLDWQMRYRIISGISRGLLYLHEDSQLRIIHRDLKSSNILLDAEMNPKISDFGIARLFHVDQTHGDTNRVVGTYGYMAPEYALHGLFSAKSDVYSFGVLVLEMISGRRNNDFNQGDNTEDLITFVWRNWREGTPMSIVDESMPIDSSTEIIRCIHIGLLCVQEDATDRPTISAVVVMMSSHSCTIPVPSHPAFVTRSLVAPNPLRSSAIISSKDSMSKSRSQQQSINEDSCSELIPR